MQRGVLIRAFSLLILYIPAIAVFSQDQRDQNWYLGNTTRSIQFTRPGDTARIVTRPVAGIAGYGDNGGAVATDPATGTLLFYTDGSTVYDATHRPMPGGAGLGGTPLGSQPAVVVAIPGRTNQYFIITNAAAPGLAGQIRVTEVDMNLPGNNIANPNSPPLGDVTAVKAVDVVGLNGEAEGMIIIPHSNNTDFWLITQKAGTGNFTVSPITAAGVAAGAAADPGTGITFFATHLAYHAPTTKLAVAPADPNRNVMVFTFDNTNGVLAFDATTGFVFNSAATGVTTLPAIYDVEWSNDANFLYVSRQGEAGTPGQLMQFDRVNTAVTPVNILPATIARSYGLQIAPDSAIYHLYQATAGGPFLVGRINDPDSASTLVRYEPLPLGNADFNARQFPSFLAKSPLAMSIDFTFAGTCANAPTTFFPQVNPAADSIVWDFGDGNFSSTWSPTHVYTAGQPFPGQPYQVTAIAYSGADSAFITKTVNIVQFDLQLTLVQDTTACSCELTFPKATPPPAPCTPFAVTAQASGAPGSIQWFGPSGALAGQNSLTLTPVDSAGFYYVIAQDPNGTNCFAYAGVNIREYGVEDPRANIWHFGNGAGIDFNPDFRPSTGADAIPGPLTSAEGSAIICDQNGQVILSTNGEQVWDRDGNLLPQTLGGSQTATQSSLIIPVAGDPTLYYVFVTQEIYPATLPGYELRYAIFDLKIAPNGGLIDPDNDPTNGASTVLFTRSTERITGNQNWLIAHEYGNNNFRAYRITPLGLSAPVISSIGSDHSAAVEENGEGYMKLSPNNILAVALSTPGSSNVVEIFDFADSTGAVTNFRQVDLQQPAGQVYGIEFSAGGQKLFASTIGTSNLHEFAYDSASGTYIRKAAIPVVNASPELGAIQRGPDGTIYGAQNGSGSLATINANEDPNAPSTYTADGFPLVSGTTSTLGLPNFMQNITDQLQTPMIAVAGVCFGAPSTLTGSGTDPIDTLTWTIANTNGNFEGSYKGVNLTSVEHTFSAPGTYVVTLQLSNRCVGLINPPLADTVVISPIPNVQSGVVSLCDGGDDERMVAILPADETPDLTYLWSHGDVTRDPIPPTDGNYTVTVTSGAGCSAVGDWEVFENRPQVELGPDRTVCENTPSIRIDAGPNVGAQFSWTRNGVAMPDTTAAVFVRTNAVSPPDFKYVVTVFNPFTGCLIKDSVTFTINPDVRFTESVTDPTGCNTQDGMIDINVTSAGVFSYTLSGPTPSTGSDFNGPGAIPTITGLDAGAYNVMVTNQVTGCFDQRTVGLSDQGTFDVTIMRGFPCNDATNRNPVAITTAPDQTPFSYRLLTGATSAVVAQGTNASNGVLTVPVTNGRYAAEVTSAGGCTVVSPVTLITQDPPVDITSFTLVDCANPSIEVISTGDIFSWAGLHIPAGQESTNRITPQPPATFAGTLMYDLHIASTAGLCPMDTTFQINIANDPPASVTQGDFCEDQVTLSASPTGTYVYVWYRDNVQIPGANVIQITAPTDDGHSYHFEAQNTTTGCIITSPPLVAAALGELTVDISNAQPCFGTDFDLTATPNQAPDSFLWRLDGDVITSASTNTLTVTDDKSGVYEVVVGRTSGGNSCFARDSVAIVVAPVTAGLLTDTGIICPYEANPDINTREVQLDPGSGFVRYEWFYEGNATGDTTQILTALQPGEYSVNLLNAFLCPSSDRITLIEECDPRISGPNAFRPGGLNKEFRLFTQFIDEQSFEIFIFNRWGEMVFHSTEREFSWNGGYNNNSGEELPPGTYAYVVKFRSAYRPEDGVQEYRGGVVLIR